MLAPSPVKSSTPTFLFCAGVRSSPCCILRFFLGLVRCLPLLFAASAAVAGAAADRSAAASVAALAGLAEVGICKDAIAPAQRPKDVLSTRTVAIAFCCSWLGNWYLSLARKIPGEDLD